MQQKYVDQFHMLYDDFNIIKLPLLPEEARNPALNIFELVLLDSSWRQLARFTFQVCGVQALQNFSKHFLAPYSAALKRGSVEELEERVGTLKSALQEAESELDRVRKGKQVAWAFFSCQKLLLHSADTSYRDLVCPAFSGWFPPFPVSLGWKL